MPIVENKLNETLSAIQDGQRAQRVSLDSISNPSDHEIRSIAQGCGVIIMSVVLGAAGLAASPWGQKVIEDMRAIIGNR